MCKKKVHQSSPFERPSTREKLIELRANPDNWNLTQREAGELLGVTSRWIKKLEADDTFWEEVFAINRRNGKGKDAAIWRSMTKEAMDGSFFHQKLYFEMTNQYTEKKQTEVKGKLTIDQLIDLIPDENK